MQVKRGSYKFDNVYLESSATNVGEFEIDGPLGKHFDLHDRDPYFGMKSWEQAEMQMLELAIRKAMEKSNLSDQDLDAAFGGDLVNQLVPTHYAYRNFDIPFFGVYGACSTMAESLMLASIFVENGYAKRAMASASSHNMMAEKQFRNPVEYGGPKSDSQQFTATAAGVGIVGRTPNGIKVESATAGIIVDALQNNPSDMGSAMAPAAADTISRHLKDFKLTPDYYDLILTGDLANVGTPILVDLLSRDGFDISKNHNDCGKMLYDGEMPVLAGGSGAGCSAAVVYGYVCDMLKQKKLNKVLVVATGALLNPTIMAQKETIPCIAHAIALSSV